MVSPTAAMRRSWASLLPNDGNMAVSFVDEAILGTTFSSSRGSGTRTHQYERPLIKQLESFLSVYCGEDIKNVQDTISSFREDPAVLLSAILEAASTEGVFALNSIRSYEISPECIFDTFAEPIAEAINDTFLAGGSLFALQFKALCNTERKVFQNAREFNDCRLKTITFLLASSFIGLKAIEIFPEWMRAQSYGEYATALFDNQVTIEQIVPTSKTSVISERSDNCDEPMGYLVPVIFFPGNFNKGYELDYSHGMYFAPSKKGYSIGRSRSCDYPIKYAENGFAHGVSRFHAKIGNTYEREPYERVDILESCNGWFIQDDSSRNGTATIGKGDLNLLEKEMLDHALATGEKRKLRNGDFIVLGLDGYSSKGQCPIEMSAIFEFHIRVPLSLVNF